jgi:hypothetical protein
MTIHWGPLLAVFVVSLGSTIAVVVLVAAALLGLSARAGGVGPSDTPNRPALFTPSAGAAVAGICLVAACVIVLFGLWTIVAR